MLTLLHDFITEEEMRKVDHHYTSISDDWRSRSSVMEERILGYQRQLEERTHTELKLEVCLHN